jgi:hypothetical protein
LQPFVTAGFYEDTLNYSPVDPIYARKYMDAQPPPLIVAHWTYPMICRMDLDVVLESTSLSHIPPPTIVISNTAHLVECETGN